MTGPFDVGDVIRISGVFRDINGLLVDPTTVQLKLKNLDNGFAVSFLYLTDAALVRDSLGYYHLDYAIPAGGQGSWIARWVTTGVGQTAEQDQFVVQPDLTA